MNKIIGQTFGKLTVIKKTQNIIGKNREYGALECLCECGNIKIVAIYHLNRGSVKSCGCIVKEGKSSLLSGQKFGKLTTISYKNSKWFCVCDCGEHTIVASSQLNSGNTKSCGCLKIENSKKQEKIDKLINGRRLNEPRIASARRVWQNYCYRDINCTISFEEFLKISQQNCFYCGTVPNTKYNYFSTISSNGSKKAKQEGLFTYNGLDRIDSNKCHTTDNVVSCCILCNRAKNDRSTKDFLLWINNLTLYTFNPINIVSLPFPSDGSLATSVKCVFYNHKKDTNLSIEEYYSISQMNCYYCNNKPSNLFNKAKTDKKSSQKAKDNGNYIYNGIDRIDVNLPHNKDNIVPCCYWCNFSKNKLSLFDFHNWILRIQKFQKEKAQI